MLGCNTACVTGKIKPRYDKESCEVLLRPYGTERMIGFHCSIEFEDILNTADGSEWATHLASGDIILTPTAGSLTIGDSSAENLETGCGDKIADVAEFPWTFTSPSVSEDYSDEDWWYDFHKQISFYSWGWLTCDSRIVLNDEVVKAIKASQAGAGAAVPVSYPGFKFSLNTIPAFKEGNGKGKAGIWTAEGTFRSKSVHRSVEIPGLAQILNQH